MSRISAIEELYASKKESALEFDYNSLWAPPILAILTHQDIQQLYQIATSLRYNANIEKKYEMIDTIMKARGFKRDHCGTNRVAYRHLDIPTFIAKVAVDKVGMRDSPAEYKNQEYFKPFCTKIFEVDPTGVIAFVERVNPITSLEEFLSVSDDVYNMMITKIIGKYVIDDLGTEKFMNYGLRYNANGTTFGPVVLDFPYAYELDGGKLFCNRAITTPAGIMRCGGEIDYDDGFNHLVCTKCKHRYKAMDLKKNNSNMIIMYGNEDGGYFKVRTRIVRNDGTVLLDSGISSKTHITKEEYDNLPVINHISDGEVHKVKKSKKVHYEKTSTFKEEYYASLEVEAYNKRQEELIDNDTTTKVTSAKSSTKKIEEDNYPLLYTNPNSARAIETVNTDTTTMTRPVKSLKNTKEDDKPVMPVGLSRDSVYNYEANSSRRGIACSELDSNIPSDAERGLSDSEIRMFNAMKVLFKDKNFVAQLCSAYGHEDLAKELLSGSEEDNFDRSEYAKYESSDEEESLDDDEPLDEDDESSDEEESLDDDDEPLDEDDESSDEDDEPQEQDPVNQAEDTSPQPVSVNTLPPYTEDDTAFNEYKAKKREDRFKRFQDQVTNIVTNNNAVNTRNDTSMKKY